jgi:selenocysteine-specific elongation factor
MDAAVGRDLVLGTAGHIDHGKTALVRALTGVDADRLPEEKARGLTIDLGFASLDLGPHRLAIVDVPGHERFVRNMLAGASGLDLAMLVIAADDSVMPQTREHLEILSLLDLPGGLVVLTKCDLADPSWLALVEDEARELVRGTFLESAEIVRVSAATGRGIDDLRAALARLCEQAPARRDPGPFRMAVDRSFTRPGHGAVATGTVASGVAAVGDELVLHPEGRPVRVRGLHRHGKAVDRIGRGTRAAVNLAGVRHEEIARGQELAAPGYLEATRVLSVELRESAQAPRSLRHRGRYRVHLGTAEASATLVLLEDRPEDGSPRLAQLVLASPVVAVHGQPFVVREESPPATLGGGRVLQPRARRIRRRDREAVARLARLRSPDPVERVRTALAFAGLEPTPDLALCALAGVALAEVGPILEGLAAAGELVEIAAGARRSYRVPAELAAELEGRALRALGRLHEARPRMSAVPLARLAAEFPDLPDGLAAGLVERLKAAGAVVADARAAALAGFEPRLSQGERRLKSELADAIRLAGVSPPSAAELASSLGGSRAAVVPELLALLRDEQRVVEVAPGLYFDADVEADLRRKVAGRLADGSTLTMSELRDLAGATRKHAVPLGEHLDRVGLTRREGDVRLLNDPSVAK